MRIENLNALINGITDLEPQTYKDFVEKMINLREQKNIKHKLVKNITELEISFMGTKETTIGYDYETKVFQVKQRPRYDHPGEISQYLNVPTEVWETIMIEWYKSWSSSLTESFTKALNLILKNDYKQITVDV